MNIAKNMEAIFLATTVLTLFAGYAQADDRTYTEPAVRTAVIHEVQTVTVTAKRLTAAEKAAFN